MPKAELVDINVQLHAETEKAVLVSVTGKRADAEWLPKSQVEIEKDKHGTHMLTLPVWLATERGLV